MQMTDRLLALNIIYFFSRTIGPISIKLGTTYLEQLLGIYIDEFLDVQISGAMVYWK